MFYHNEVGNNTTTFIKIFELILIIIIYIITNI